MYWKGVFILLMKVVLPTLLRKQFKYLIANMNLALTGVGWLYGSLSEDILTGLNIHKKGWRSECSTPDPIAFTGCAPGLLTTMIQQKRWASGLTVVFFGKLSPVLGTLYGKIELRAALSFCWLASWGLRSVFEVCYAILIAHCVITNTNIFPEVKHLNAY